MYHATANFQITTVPEDPRFGVQHTGGWSEGIWSQTDPLVTDPGRWVALLRARANLLPSTAVILGTRVQKYEMAGNKLQPQGSKITTAAYVGRAGITTDLPQAALQLVATNPATPNKAVVILRAIPDDYIKGGEFAPTPAYLGFLTSFRTQLTSNEFGFVGRDLSQASVRVLSASVADGILLDGIPATGLVVGNYVRFNRVVTSTGVLVTGSWQVTNIAGNVIRVANWTHIVVKAGGTVRRDQMVFVQYVTTYLRRATVKKIGAPFEKYRGRRAKVRR